LEYASIAEWMNGPMNSLKDTRAESKRFIEVLSLDGARVDNLAA